MKIDLQNYTPDISDEELKQNNSYLETVACIKKHMGNYCNTMDGWKCAQSELLHAHGEEYRDIYLMHRTILLALDELSPIEDK